MATLYKRGTRYYLNWREEGRQFRRSLGAIDRQAAEAIRAEKEAELRGLIRRGTGITTSELLDEYERWYAQARPTTAARARSALKPFRLEFGRWQAEGLSPAEIEGWALRQTARASTEKALKLVRAAYKRAMRLQAIRQNPMERVTIEKAPTSRAPAYYRPEQLRELLDKAPSAPIWQFMVATGIRRSEASKARRGDIRDGMLVVESLPEGRTKSGKWRAIPLNEQALQALGKLGDDRLIPYAPDTLTHRFAAEAAAAGVGGNLHMLRHTFCTALVQSGVSLHDVKRLAGHSSITVTERYAHHAPGFGREAVATMGAWLRQTPRRESTPKSTRRR